LLIVPDRSIISKAEEKEAGNEEAFTVVSEAADVVDGKEMVLPTHLEDATFVRIIVMLPQALFWAAVKVVGDLV
jgi:hypothetical protein